MIQQKGMVLMAVVLFSAIVGVAQGAEQRKLPRLVDQCKASCVTSAKGDAKKQASCEHMCGVIFDGEKKVAQDTSDEPAPAPTEGEEWRVRFACGDSCQTSLWLCEDGCTDRGLPSNSNCNADCSTGYHGCNTMCHDIFGLQAAPMEGADE